MGNTDIGKYQELVEQYDPKIINICPKSADELYGYYRAYTQILLDCVFEEIETLPYVLTNEIRAMVGHLSEHNTRIDLSNYELQKAYGHFRRLNLDAMKILCDEFDKGFSNFISKSHKYPYYKVEEGFMASYAKCYFEARQLFLEAQFSEGVGSNYKANVYETYFNAVKKYIELQKYYLDNLKEIRKIRRVTIIKKVVALAWSLANIAVSLALLF